MHGGSSQAQQRKATNGEEANYTYYSAGVAYLNQVVINGQLSQESVLNQAIYDAKVEEAEAAKAAKQ